MLFNLIENRLTFKPNPEYDSSLIPEDLTLTKVSGSNFQIQLAYKITDSPILSINCHGNASNLSHLGPLYRFYNCVGCSHLIFDYPGYGESTGKPTEKSLYESLDIVIEFAQKELGFSLSQIVLHGISLGGAVAINGMHTHKVAAGIIDASFTNNIDMAQFMFPILPLHKLISPKFDSITKVKEIEQPMLFFHGSADEVIPPRMGKELYEAKKNGVRELIILENLGHADEEKIESDICVNGFKEFLLENVVL